MAVVSYKGIDIATDDGLVHLFKSGNLVYTQDFTPRIHSMEPVEAEDFLIRAGVVLADQYLEGSLSGMQELEPWE